MRPNYPQFVLRLIIALLVLIAFGVGIGTFVGNRPLKVLSTPAPTAEPTNLPLVQAPDQEEVVVVVRVVDGDTLRVQITNHEEVVRVIGIDTPELTGEGAPQCYATQARERLAQLAGTGAILLRGDTSQQDTDRYGRRLRYLESSSGEDLGRLLILEGYAREYTYDRPYAQQAEYRAAEALAKQEGRGLWSAC
jgi:micrococcal nuclease